MPFSFYNALLSDIEQYGWDHIGSLTESLQQFTFSIEDPSHRSHDIQVTLPATYPLGAPICQIALPEDATIKWPPQNTIQSIHDTISDLLKKYDEDWTVLEDFDRHCIILDPSNPTFSHNYRRIFLGSLFYAMS